MVDETGSLRDMLRLMEKNADERHEMVSVQLGKLTEVVEVVEKRVTTLENDGAQRKGWVEGRDKVVAASVGLLGAAVGIPAAIMAIVALKGGGG